MKRPTPAPASGVTGRAACAGPLPRREFLQVGALALGGATLPTILAGRAAAGQARTDTSVILLYLHGGPSHLETYDLKPEAPIEYRSIFHPIPTNVPGMDICELMPRQAQLGDKMAIVRSLHHEMSSHSDGGIEVLTGKTPVIPDPTSQSKSDHPDIGSVLSKVRGMSTNAIPPYIAIPRSTYMTQPTYLGLQHGALVCADPSTEYFQPPIGRLSGGIHGERLGDRRALLAQFDHYRHGVDLHGNVAATGEFTQLAFQVLTSPQTAAAFDLTQEPDVLRDRYGRNLWGQSCLLARRLCEAGTAVVSLYVDTPKGGAQFTNWDDHIANAGQPGHFGDYFRRRMEYFDPALAALIEDVYARNLDRRIMIVVLGEFGRTPRLSHNATGTGRDHWPQAYSVLFSGGGLKTGQVIGATNAKGEYPTERPLTPQDVLATIYQHLGVDYHHNLVDHAGRPVPILPIGEPIAELV
ncbi:MAG: DUF1501 domain-containing protein [Planctomycetaceae bacterium]|nr:DUF1501 domain-containing protein [Planctomycetaceae bacterium]